MAGKLFSVIHSTETASHVVRDAQGVAWVDDSNVKVVEIALDHLAYGWSAEAIHEQFPHLTLAQIHGALAFFYDHQTELEQEIRLRESEVAAWRAELGESALQQRLRQIKQERGERGSARLPRGGPMLILAHDAGARSSGAGDEPGGEGPTG